MGSRHRDGRRRCSDFGSRATRDHAHLVRRRPWLGIRALRGADPCAQPPSRAAVAIRGRIASYRLSTGAHPRGRLSAPRTNRPDRARAGVQAASCAMPERDAGLALGPAEVHATTLLKPRWLKKHLDLSCFKGGSPEAAAARARSPQILMPRSVFFPGAKIFMGPFTVETRTTVGSPPKWYLRAPSSHD